jgi:DNA repair exonuclease SbcCD nuclease subunit
MKLLIVGDLHFRPELPYAAAFDDGRRGEWNKALETIHKASENADAVVLMGDNLNTRHNHSTVIREFVEFLKGFGDKDVHILIGNHERYGDSTALDFLERMEHAKWHVYSNPTQCNDLGDGTTATFIPFMTSWLAGGTGDFAEDATNFLDTLKPADVAFFHQGISGAVTHGTMVDLFNELVFDAAKLEKLYSRVFSGHIHQHQELSPITTMTGSVFTMEVGDYTKFVYLYDSKAKTTERIQLPVRGIYKLVNEEHTDEKIPATSIVKCEITERDVYDIDNVKKVLSRFDASVLIEKYPSERKKIDIQGASIGLDLDSLLQMYAKAKDLSYNTLKEGLDLLKSS